jgi:hypothetical protein
VHPQSCFFTTAVWGRWHTDMFLSVNLPTLLAPGNLPSFARLVPTRYRIYTTAADRDTMRRSRLLAELKRFVELEIVEIPQAGTADPIATHHRLWGQSMAEAAEQGALTVLMPPDVLWSDGSFTHVARAIAAGKSAIFMTYLRVISETFVSEFLDASAPPARIRAIASRPLLDMALRHLHPVIAAYRRDGGRFPRHAEMVIWPVPGDGFLLRMLARELFVLDPRRFKLSPHQLLRDPPDVGDVHVVTDSDDLLALSLTPFLKDAAWYASPRRLDTGAIARWWLEYDSPANELIAAHNLRFHLGNADDGTWRRFEREADALVRRCLFTRNALRIAKAFELMGCGTAAQLLASALSHARLARHWRTAGPIAVLAPDEGAFDGVDVKAWLTTGAEAKLRRAIEAHVAPLPSELSTMNGKPFEEPRHVRLRTLAGEDVAVTIEPGVAGDPLGAPPRALWADRNLVIRTDRILLTPERPSAVLEPTHAGAA